MEIWGKYFLGKMKFELLLILLFNFITNIASIQNQKVFLIVQII
jgi:hypothetical protein